MLYTHISKGCLAEIAISEDHLLAYISLICYYTLHAQCMLENANILYTIGTRGTTGQHLVNAIATILALSI